MITESARRRRTAPARLVGGVLALVVALLVTPVALVTTAPDAAAQVVTEPDCVTRSGGFGDGAFAPTYLVDDGDVTTAIAGEPVKLVGFRPGSTDPTAVTADWGDGTTSAAANVHDCMMYFFLDPQRGNFYHATHTYPTPGTYVASLSGVGRSVQIRVIPPDDTPASPSATPTATAEGQAIRVTAKDPAGGATDFRWRITRADDGEQVAEARGQDTLVPVPGPDRYRVALTVCRAGAAEGAAEPTEQCAAMEGRVTVEVTDGEPGGTVVPTVTGTSARLELRDPPPGATGFDWTVTGGAAPITRTGQDVTVQDLAPGTYEARVGFCRTQPVLSCQVRQTTFVVEPDLAFEARPVPGEPLVRRLVVTAPAAGASYSWTVAGTAVGTGPDVRWTAPRTGTFPVVLTVAVGGLTRSATRQISLGYTIAVDNSASRGLVEGTVDPTKSCDPRDTVLTVSSRTGVWAELRTSASDSLTRRPEPGTVAALGLLPPSGTATWTGGCFDAVPQSFQVRADITTDRALAATAFAGFLATVSGGNLDANAMARALTAWENVQQWPLPESRAAVAEFGRVLTGKGRMPVAIGHAYAAVTHEPEAGQLREFLFAIGQVIPKVDSFTALAEGASNWFAGNGLSPYDVGARVTSDQLEKRKAATEQRIGPAQGRVDRATADKAQKQQRVDEITADITAAETARQGKAADLARTVCTRLPPQHPCFTTQRRLRADIDRLDNRLTQLRTRALPPATDRLTAATTRLTDATTEVDQLRKAVDNLGFAASFVGQLTAIIELSVNVYRGDRVGVTTFSTRA